MRSGRTFESNTSKKHFFTRRKNEQKKLHKNTFNFRFNFQFNFHRAAPPQRRTHEAARAAGAVGHPQGAALALANRLEPGQASEEGFREDLNI